MKKRVLLMIMCVFAITASAQINSVAIVGAGAGGWPSDNSCGGPVDQNQMNLVSGTTDQWILENVVITGPNFKFRANNCWNVSSDSPEGRNIGAPATGSHFPSAIGTDNGGSAPISVGVIPGTYTVKLNTTTFAYSFEGGVEVPVVKLFGTAVDGGTVDMIATSAVTFESKLNLLDGTAQFDVDGTIISDAVLVGNALEGGPAVTITAGKWIVKLNIETGDYSFEVAPFDTISLIGAAVGGWDEGVNALPMTTTDGITYTRANVAFDGGSIESPNGFLIIGPGFNPKFGADVKYTDIFATPTGTLVEGAQDLGLLPSSNGTYDITFNLNTKEYTTSLSLSTKGFSTANFKVSPNPTTNNWNFSTANDSIESIQILDVLGKNVMTVSPRSNTANVDASSLTRGIYFAKVATATATQTLKLMKN